MVEGGKKDTGITPSTRVFFCSFKTAEHAKESANFVDPLVCFALIGQ